MEISEFVVMPNHIHFIITINRTANEKYNLITGLAPLAVQSVSSFINHFKGTVTRWCKDNNEPEFTWQSRFYDRVIRDAAEYQRAACYIQTNVENWPADKENL